MKAKDQFILSFIRFEKTLDNQWECLTRKNVKLGHIELNPRWNKWVYVVDIPAEYSRGCLNDIADFLKQLEANP